MYYLLYFFIVYLAPINILLIIEHVRVQNSGSYSRLCVSLLCCTSYQVFFFIFCSSIQRKMDAVVHFYKRFSSLGHNVIISPTNQLHELYFPPNNIHLYHYCSYHSHCYYSYYLHLLKSLELAYASTVEILYYNAVIRYNSAMCHYVAYHVFEKS